MSLVFALVLIGLPLIVEVQPPVRLDFGDRHFMIRDHHHWQTYIRGHLGQSKAAVAPTNAVLVQIDEDTMIFFRALA